MELKSFLEILHEEFLHAGVDESILKEISLYGMQPPSYLSTRNLVKKLCDNNLQSKIEELEEEVSSLKDENNEYEFKIEDLTLELNEAKYDISELKKGVFELTSELEELRGV